MPKPLISVVLATRDRAGLFQEALDSVLGQRYDKLEIVVVSDGSSPEQLALYQPVWDAARARLGERFNAHCLVRRPKGHGQSYSLNYGTAQARGDYVCFLDDDDKWTDPEHLSRVAAAIDAAAAQGRTVDLYMANQDAWATGERHVGTLWLGTLASELQARGRSPDASGCYEVSVEDLMASTGFCHLNCLTVRRALFEQVGGMDEGIRWECDRDLYLKLIDAAGLMLHHPQVMAYHRVPDPTKSNNMTTALGMVEKRLLQSIVLDRAMVRARHPAIRRHAREHKGYALKRIAQELAGVGDWTGARYYAGQALGATPGLKWAAFWLRCVLRSRFARA
ncbi:glycosyltransferase family 2 protein [Aquabacterium sp.]|uniref:glycosyltransferase family 2 protein n=1 Tax=Aquabacterium sp. TaxID=1872578 RepID=UPI0037848D65